MIRESTLASPAAVAPARAIAADPWTYFFLLGGLGNLANGLWMLVDAPGWYTGIPAAVPDFGPLNEHFVRDLGTVFSTFGLALIWAAWSRSARFPILLTFTVFTVGHALVHVYDTLRGLVGPEHWAIDFPAVYLPAFVLIGLCALLARSREARA